MQSNNDATFVGISSIDFLYYVDGLPRSNQKLRAEDTITGAGGMAANAASAYGLLGGQPKLVTASGNDSFSELVLKELSKCNVTVTDVAPEEYRFPSSVIILDSSNGSRTVISSPKSEYDKFNISQCDGDLGRILFVDGFFYPVCINYLKKAKASGVPVVFDADKWRSDDYHEYLEYIDIVIASEDFFPPGCNTVNDTVSFFKNRSAKKFAITRGEQSILCFEDNNHYKIEIDQNNKIIDTLGAGDILHGAFCKFYSDGMDFKQSLLKASQIATLSCTIKGTIAWADNHLA